MRHCHSAGSGLSSSAAIVCSSSLAIAAALGLTSHLTKGAVSEFTCTAERYVGVTSGGMDQAISVMGMPGLALLVEFNPVSNSCHLWGLTSVKSLYHSASVSHA
jgi:N-acetylgalactosamine kinase